MPTLRAVFETVGPVVTVRPDRDLSIAEVVAVARGDGSGVYPRVELGGDWCERCERSSAYVADVVSRTMGLDTASLCELVRERFAGGEVPPSLAPLMADVSRGGAGDAAVRGKAGDAESPGVDADVAARSKLALRALVYGVTTGFGHNKDKPLRTREQAARLQLNLLRSHATGVGAPLPIEVVRAAMLLRLRSFIEGCSGVRPVLVERLCEMLNRRVHPWVPRQGSVGSSGDLCPLAHLFQVLVGEGFAWVGDGVATAGEDAAPVGDGVAPAGDGVPRVDPLPGAEAMRSAGLEPLGALEPKEGLALTNGTSVTTALAALAVYDAGVLLGYANLTASMSLQAMLGCTRALDPKVHRVRRQPGQAAAARAIMALAAGGGLLDGSDDVQDSYSLRCAPQVHGAAWTAIEHVWSVVEREINAVTDNPLLFLEDMPKTDNVPGSDDCAAGSSRNSSAGACAGSPAESSDGSPTDSPAEAWEPYDRFGKCIWSAYSAGNFHGEPIGMVMDYLKIAVAELAAISERRIQLLFDAHHNRGLPANLAPGASLGLNSGMMIAQYAAASLVSENKVLCHPSSVDSIPTSSNVEDHVAMSTTAARHARDVNDNARHVLAIEMLAAVRALLWRARLMKRKVEELVSPSAWTVCCALSADPVAADVLDLDADDVGLSAPIAAARHHIQSPTLLASVLSAKTA